MDDDENPTDFLQHMENPTNIGWGRRIYEKDELEVKILSFTKNYFFVFPNKFQSDDRERERMALNDDSMRNLNMKIKDVNTTLNSSRRHLSLDMPIQTEETTNLYDFITSETLPSPDNELNGESLAVEINRALGSLQRKEREIVIMFYGINKNTPMSLGEIGRYFGITTERVRQIKENAIRRLAQGGRKELLQGYLG